MIVHHQTSIDKALVAVYTSHYQAKEIAMSDDIIAEVCRRREAGETIPVIARAIGKRNHFVMQVLRDAGAYAVDDMDDDARDQIKKSYLDGRDVNAIAAAHGVTHLAIMNYLYNCKLARRIVRGWQQLDDGTIVLPLTRGKVSIVDADDLGIIGRRAWFMTGTETHPYAATRGPRGPVTLHAMLMSPPSGSHVDHINGNTLDNRRANLRVVSPSENIANSRRRKRVSKTGFLGVKKLSSGRFFAYARISGIDVSLGTYDTPEEAAMAYDQAVTDAFGEHVDTNGRRGLL